MKNAEILAIVLGGPMGPLPRFGPFHQLTTACYALTLMGSKKTKGGVQLHRENYFQPGSVMTFWPTKENMQKLPMFLYVSGPRPDGPKWGQEDFFPTDPDLADILGDMDFDFENLYFFRLFWISNFQISSSQISKFPEIWLGPSLGPGLGPGWAWTRTKALIREAKK